ncbi:hypothetical protein [Asticcacaulis sp. AND118]|uniref:hypothetical protein n=1 Tax=Asticcacaulis sp. AND118 TaxID=2840468 RepID=UPI001CFF5BD6|nr:hypothetical protein [Asticcacaulis sp. AND118]UDF03816.1 hypothetical protein LH365_01875 [Asticcacaulis sp. AND118]
MNTYTRPDTIIDFCLAPLQLDPRSEASRETRRRLEHVLRTYQLKLAQPVAVDFSHMPTLTINEAAHGYE